MSKVNYDAKRSAILKQMYKDRVAAAKKAAAEKAAAEKLEADQKAA